jgi:hypothetical protein
MQAKRNSTEQRIFWKPNDRSIFHGIFHLLQNTKHNYLNQKSPLPEPNPTKPKPVQNLTPYLFYIYLILSSSFYIYVFQVVIFHLGSFY